MATKARSSGQMTAKPIIKSGNGLRASPISAFGSNLQQAFDTIDSLKALVQRLGDTHALEVVGHHVGAFLPPQKPAFASPRSDDSIQQIESTPRASPRSDDSIQQIESTPRYDTANSPRVPGSARSRALPLEIALPNPDKIDVISISDHEESKDLIFLDDEPDTEFYKSHASPEEEDEEDGAKTRKRIKIRDIWATTEELKDLEPSPSLLSAQKKLRHKNLRKNTGGVGLTGSFISLESGMGCGMMHPQSQPRMCWTALSIVFVAWDVFSIPLQVFKPPAEMSPWILDLIIVSFWTLDIFMSIRTGVFRHGLLILDPTLVAREYACTWLIPDIVVVAVEWIALIYRTTKSFSLARGVRIVRIVRLLRLAKLRALLSTLEHRFPAGTLHLFMYVVKLFFILLVLVHFIACSWYGLGTLNETNGWTIVENVEGEDLTYRYFLCARWTLAQINGRTDLQRRTMTEYAFTCVVIFGAFIVICLFISEITNAMMQITVVTSERKRAKDLLRMFLDQRAVSAELAMNVKMCYTQRSQAFTDDLKIQDVLKTLPKPMLFELLQHVRAPLLKVHALFSKLSAGYPMAFRHVCAEAVQVVSSLPDEVIFNTGEACSRMLTVENGIMRYFSNCAMTDSFDMQKSMPSNRLMSLRKSSIRLSFEDVALMERDSDGLKGEPVGKGRWVTESALWAYWETLGMLQSASMCNMLVMEAAEVARIMDLYKDAHAVFSFYAVLYVEAIHAGKAFKDLVPIDATADITTKVVNNNLVDLLAHVTDASVSQQRKSTKQHLIRRSEF